jgi:hypothetical protein
MILDILAWIAAAPVFVLRAVFRSRHHGRFWTVAYAATLGCQACGAEISLLGMWECRCGYTYQGNVLRVCPVCHSLPRMIRCFSCGNTEVLPQP